MCRGAFLGKSMNRFLSIDNGLKPAYRLLTLPGCRCAVIIKKHSRGDRIKYY